MLSLLAHPLNACRIWILSRQAKPRPPLTEHKFRGVLMVNHMYMYGKIKCTAHVWLDSQLLICIHVLLKYEIVVQPPGCVHKTGSMPEVNYRAFLPHISNWLISAQDSIAQSNILFHIHDFKHPAIRSLKHKHSQFAKPVHESATPPALLQSQHISLTMSA